MRQTRIGRTRIRRTIGMTPNQSGTLTGRIPKTTRHAHGRGGSIAKPQLRGPDFMPNNK